MLNKQIRNELKSENETYNSRVLKLQFANGVKIEDFGLLNYSILISNQLQFHLKRFNERDYIFLNFNCFYHPKKLQRAQQVIDLSEENDIAEFENALKPDVQKCF